MPTSLITGVGGQDGILLSRCLLKEGHRVIGTVHAAADRVQLYAPEVGLRRLDVRDRVGLRALLDQERPDEIYNLAAASSVAKSWGDPWRVTEVNGLAVLGLLEAVRELHDSDGYSPRICQASSSEMFGLSQHAAQNEVTAHHPRSPYATAKSFAHYTAVNYRESYDLFVATAILFNHESPLRPRTFVTRKITSAVSEIALGTRKTLTLGRTDIRRDWGSALDYVEAMRRLLRHDVPLDVCIATGESRSVADFVKAAFRAVGITEGLDRVVTDPSLSRPAEVFETRGNPRRALAELGWRPQSSFDDLIAWMVSVDLRRAQTGMEDDASYLLLEPSPASGALR